MRNGLLVVGSTVLSYVLFEAIFYLALCFGLPVPAHPYYTYSAWTNPNYIAADPLIGIRLRPHQPNTGIRVIQGDVQFYYRGIPANSAGFFSDHEYYAAKQRPYRVVVYGSSFVAMLFQDRSWVDHLNDLLEKDGIEVYNFSFDGGALANWHAHYFRELVPAYEYDMVVFPMWAGDIKSIFVVSETRSTGYFVNGFSVPPHDAEDLDRNYRPQLRRVLGMAAPEFLEHLNAHFTRHKFMALPFDLYALKSVRLAIFGDQTSSVVPQGPPVSSDPAKERVLFESMLQDLRTRRKTAIVVAIPTRNSSFLINNPDVEKLRSIAAHSCVDFVDGNELFRKSATPEQVASYWPRYEGHWLKRGGDRFAEILAPILVEARSPQDRASTATGACH